MFQDLSIRKKILILIGGTTAVSLIIAAIFLVNHIAAMSRSSIEKDVSSTIKAEKLEAESFFCQDGRIGYTINNTPPKVNLMDRLDSRGTDFKNSPGYDEFNGTFVQIASDENVLSAFFASAVTGEYYKENDRTAQYADGRDYFAYARPWWQEALGHAKLYVGPLSSDINTGAVSAVVQTPVYKGSKLVGIGGVDLQLNSIRDLTENVSFQGVGYGFLLDQNKKVVHLSNKTGHNLSITDEDRGKMGLDELEKQFKDTHGFKDLNKMMASKLSGTGTVTMKGEEYFVAFDRLQLDVPKLDWTLGLLVPMSIIEEPVKEAKFATTTAVIVILFVLAVIIFWATQMIAKPLHHVASAMEDISSGEGDLTRKINISSRDEVGQLANNFNQFVTKLHGLMTQTANQASTLQSASQKLSAVSSSTNAEIQTEKAEVESVSTAVTQMAATALEISRNASETNTAAADAQHISQSGYQISLDAVEEIRSLAQSMDEAVSVVQGLARESENIGTVVDVINGIAEQTNLLALNAAIEAARAGEQGRGFAVVADEVRSLAGRTQESTEDIRKMIATLQSISNEAAQVMEKGRAQTESGVSKTQEVQDSLQSISQAVTVVQDQSSQIAVATEEQTVVAENINESLTSITTLVEKTAQHADELAHEAEQLNDTASDLNRVVNQFKL